MVPRRLSRRAMRAILGCVDPNGVPARLGCTPDLRDSCALWKENVCHACAYFCGDSRKVCRLTAGGKLTHSVAKLRMYWSRVRSRRKGAPTNCSRHAHGTGPIGDGLEGTEPDWRGEGTGGGRTPLQEWSDDADAEPSLWERPL